MTSRAGLSIGMMIFFACCFLHGQWKQQWTNFTRHLFLPGISMLFLLPFISGLWSDDMEEWLDIMRIKLPLLLFPLAFAGPWQLGARQWMIIGYAWIIMALGGSIWSSFQYLQNAQEIHEGYLRAKVFATPLQNDHVRFSWMVTAAIITGLVCFERTASKIVKWLLVVCITWFAIYLHLLAARTGLLAFYIFLVLYGCHLVIRKRNFTRAVIVVSLLVALPFLAWLALPTFQNRIRYNIYDITEAKGGGYRPGYNDGNRITSLRAASAIIKKHPFGVGAGDVFREADQWYEQNIPGMVQTDKLYPSSEWMIYGCAAGWPGIFLFSASMLLPLLHRTARLRFYWNALNIVAAASFIFDIGLEVQFGVFLYVFPVLWYWKWLNQNVPEHE
jgi:hypothetical protein